MPIVQMEFEFPDTSIIATRNIKYFHPLQTFGNKQLISMIIGAS